MMLSFGSWTAKLRGSNRIRYEDPNLNLPMPQGRAHALRPRLAGSVLTEQRGFGPCPSVLLFRSLIPLSVRRDFRADSSACLTRCRNLFNSYN
jgi:hypothetical protein